MPPTHTGVWAFEMRDPHEGIRSYRLEGSGRKVCRCPKLSDADKFVTSLRFKPALVCDHQDILGAEHGLGSHFYSGKARLTGKLFLRRSESIGDRLLFIPDGKHASVLPQYRRIPDKEYEINLRKNLWDGAHKKLLSRSGPMRVAILAVGYIYPESDEDGVDQVILVEEVNFLQMKGN